MSRVRRPLLVKSLASVHSAVRLETILADSRVSAVRRKTALTKSHVLAGRVVRYVHCSVSHVGMYFECCKLAIQLFGVRI
jgi:hypothetical protein